METKNRLFANKWFWVSVILLILLLLALIICFGFGHRLFDTLGSALNTGSNAPENTAKNGISVKSSFSVNGQPFAGELTDDNAISPGQNITARVEYNNQSATAGRGVSIDVAVPSGFSLVPGSIKNCITPSSGEKVCNTDKGQAGAIVEGAVWNGSHLTISPTAGLYNISGGQTSGIMEIGKKRYLNLQNCDYSNNVNANTDDSYAFAPGNKPVAVLNCPGAAQGTTFRPQNSLAQPVDLLGKRYANLYDCDYINNTNNNIDDTVRFVPSNAVTGLSCAGAFPGTTFRSANSLYSAGDLLGNRYANFRNCDMAELSRDSTDDQAQISPANSPIAAGSACGAPLPNMKIRPEHSKVDPLDLLDTARGKGYIEFTVRAPNAAGTYTQTATIKGDNIPTLYGTADLEVR